MPCPALDPRLARDVGYQRRDPESTDLHRLVRDNLEPFLAYTRNTYRKPLPRYVERELRRFVQCGVLGFGFTRWRCPRCAKDLLVAFSCKCRICPSCQGRRMAQAGAHLIDRVLPDAPLRQWVLTVPFELRRLLAADSNLLGAVLRIFVRVVDRFYLSRARQAGMQGAKTGMVTAIQRFGGSMNLHCHVHAGALDGFYTVDERGAPRFHFVAPPTPDDIESVAGSVGERVCKLLKRRGLIGLSPGSGDSALDACRIAGLSRGRFERLDDQGQSQQRLFPDDDPRFALRTKSPWTAEVNGFSVHAGVCFGALDRKGRECLVRYFLRPAIATDRLTILRDGSVAYRTKYGKGARTHRVMTPMEAMARIAALVPPPRSPLLRYHGVVAAGSKLRARIVPVRSRPASPCCEPDVTTQVKHHTPSSKPTSAAPAAIVSSSQPQPAQLSWRRTTSYIPWAELMRRTLDIDPAQCTCGGKLKPIAIITREEVVQRILSHLSLPSVPAPVGPGRSMAFDVTGEPVGEWVVGLDPDPPDAPERGPPAWDGVDPPSPDV